MESLLTQRQIAFMDGYIERFVFIENRVFSLSNPKKMYPIITIEKRPYPCIITETIVYRITTNDGTKGIAILDFEQNEPY